MTLEEFYEKPKVETTKVMSKPKDDIEIYGPDGLVITPSNVHLIEDDGLDDVLPINVMKMYKNGQVVYRHITEDGQLVDLDEWGY